MVRLLGFGIGLPGAKKYQGDQTLPDQGQLGAAKFRKYMSTLPDVWLPLEKPWITPEGRWESRVRFEPGSEWFSGHFEKTPLLPGVALLALASEMVKRQATENGRVFEVFGFTRVRFKLLVLPGNELCISVAAMPSDPEAKLDFKITCQDELVVQGFLKARAGSARRSGSDETAPARAWTKER